MGNGLLHREQRALDVGAEEMIKILFSDIVQRSILPEQSGVQDEDVNLAESVDSLLNQPLDVVQFGDVGLDGDERSAPISLTTSSAALDEEM
jgi:hypothetical protein